VQLVSRVERAAATLPAGSDPPPMSSDHTPATGAFRYPFCRRSDNRAIAAAGAVAAEFFCFGFPHSVVPVIRSYECVCDFVEDCVSDFWLKVQEGKSLAQRDRANAVHAETEATHGPVKLKVPMGQTVFGHQLLSEGFGVLEDAPKV
jgi:hypothetical protein